MRYEGEPCYKCQTLHSDSKVSSDIDLIRSVCSRRNSLNWIIRLFNSCRLRCALALAHNCFTVFSVSSVSINSTGYSQERQAPSGRCRTSRPKLTLDFRGHARHSTGTAWGDLPVPRFSNTRGGTACCEARQSRPDGLPSLAS